MLYPAAWFMSSVKLHVCTKSDTIFFLCVAQIVYCIDNPLTIVGRLNRAEEQRRTGVVEVEAPPVGQLPLVGMQLPVEAVLMQADQAALAHAAHLLHDLAAHRCLQHEPLSLGFTFQTQLMLSLCGRLQVTRKWGKSQHVLA